MDFVKDADCSLRCAAVIVAAGSSQRMGEDKLDMLLAGQSVLERSIRAISLSECVAEIVLVTRADKLERVEELCRSRALEKVKCVVAGGENRTISACNGVRACSAEWPYIAIHDAARPLVTAELIERTLVAAAEHGAAAPAIGVKDTVRLAEGSLAVRTLAREELFLMQTPQIFASGLIREALNAAVEEGLALPDDCEAVMRAGGKVYLVEGSEENIKLTTRRDVFVAEAILEARG